MRDLSGRTAIVTGASRGLGRYIARALAAVRMNLVLAARTVEGLEAARKEAQATGVKVVTVPTDLVRRADLEALVAAATREFGAVDVLVNNAGTLSLFPYERLTPDGIEHEMQVNLIAPMLLTRLVLPGMLERRQGHVVNISSMAGKTGPPFGAPYAASKAGLIGFTESLRSEYSGRGVSASVICPGYVEEAGMYQEMKEKAGAVAPALVGTVGPDPVARAVVRAIIRDVPEIIVNAFPTRPLTVLLEAAPALGERLLRSVDAFRPFREGAEANVRKADAPRTDST
ncbi:MAG TPA: SDR family oxidoreductase [Vicinamibacteria bacterium]|jgi:short-subunit dehydrogenase